jgi:hypothetical protein
LRGDCNSRGAGLFHGVANNGLCLVVVMVGELAVGGFNLISHQPLTPCTAVVELRPICIWHLFCCVYVAQNQHDLRRLVFLLDDGITRAQHMHKSTQTACLPGGLFLIFTQIEVNMQNIIDIENQHTSGTYAKQPFVIVRGQGASLFDMDGVEYIDCSSGNGVANLGHAHPKIAERSISRRPR